MASLAGRCAARGNDSNQIRLPIAVHNDQQTSFAVVAESDPALFVMVVILNRQCSLIVEDRFGLGEADPSVLEFVGSILAFVELNLE